MTSIDDCISCPAGKACELKGDGSAATALPDCAAGYYCTLGSPTKYPFTDVSGSYGPCPAGHYCEVGTSSATPCVAGTFSM